MLSIKEKKSFFVIAGPCAVESKAICEEVAETVVQICEELKLPYIFKASYRKANRSRLDSFTGIGDDKGLAILDHIKRTYKIPVTTDIHNIPEAQQAAQVVDVLQIPAFLCRQTDLLVAAAETGKIVNIKKGQFMSAPAMKFAVQKIEQTSESPVWLTERGTTFGYQDLVVDFRNIPWLKTLGTPVILDCTHSLQQPNQSEGVTGGHPDLVDLMVRTGIAAGADGLFIETHPNPSKALSDGKNMVSLDKMPLLLESAKRIHDALSTV